MSGMNDNINLYAVLILIFIILVAIIQIGAWMDKKASKLPQTRSASYIYDTRDGQDRRQIQVACWDQGEDRRQGERRGGYYGG